MSGPQAPVGEAEAPPQRSPASRMWFWLPIAPLVVADLWSKAAVFAFLDGAYPGAGVRARHLVWEGFVRFDLVAWHNTGTIWGLFQSYNYPLVILRCAAVVAILGYVVFRLREPTRGLLLVLSGILAGALGNLYDNFTEPRGGVRDFLFFTFFPGSSWQYEFPAFNVADSCISVGVCCLVVSTLFAGSSARTPTGPAA